MNCCVPEFFLEDDTVFPPSFVRNLADSSGGDFVELLWDNGPVYRRTSQEELRNRSGVLASSVSASAGAEPFLEDEMASWLDYPLGDGEDRGTVGYTDRFDLPLKPQTTAAVVPWTDGDGWRTPGKPPEMQEKLLRPLGSGESAIVDSSVTSDPTMVGPPEPRASSGREKGETGTCEQGLTSSSGVICEAEAADQAAPNPEARKRKAADPDDSDSLSESIDKQDDTRRSAPKRRPRAAEVHNLSERRRRDRINEKMKALQELIPRCNKSDKASMLDDAIRYLKSLQTQVQMMSMNCNMFPMMFPGAHQFVPAQMGMALPMGMNMGLGMGALGGPMPPFLPVLPGSRMAPASAAPLSQGSPPMQPFQAFFGHVAPQAGQANPTLLRPATPNLANHIDPPRQKHAGFPHLEGHPQNSEQGAGSRGVGMAEKPRCV